MNAFSNDAVPSQQGRSDILPEPAAVPIGCWSTMCRARLLDWSRRSA